MEAAHSVTALWQQLLFRFNAEQRIIDNHEQIEILHAACIKALQKKTTTAIMTVQCLI